METVIRFIGACSGKCDFSRRAKVQYTLKNPSDLAVKYLISTVAPTFRPLHDDMCPNCEGKIKLTITIDNADGRESLEIEEL